MNKMEDITLNNKRFEIFKVKWKRLGFLFISILIISFFMKYVSEWTHEFLGHGGFGFLLGGILVKYYVSWIWPLEFGYAYVSLPLGSGSIARAIVASGGIISCGMAALISQMLIFLVIRKRKSNSMISFIGLHFLFWYGLWAFMNSTGYLLVGGLLNFGDIGQIMYYTGISNIVFILVGFVVLFVLFYVISLNFYYLFKQLIYLKIRWMFFSIWLIIPLVYVLFVFNPSITISLNLFLILLPIMFIPCIFAFLLSTFIFRKRQNNNN